VRLPVAGVPPPSRQSEIDVAAPPRIVATRVLLAEDQALNRQIVAELLTPLGIDVDHAENGRQAVEILEAAPAGRHDLVLMDIQMPEMDGLTAARLLRAQPRFAALPIIALTAHTLSHERTETLASGMNDHLGKPFNPQRLYEILHRWLPAAKRLTTPPPVATPAVPPTQLPGLPGFDFAGALHRCGGRGDSYRRWLRTFLAEDAGAVDDIDRLLAAGELDTARRQLHALKGRAGMLGMTYLYAAVSALEAEMRQGSASAPLLAAFRDAFVSARAAIAQLVDRLPDGAGPTSSQEIRP
jgi:two-component system sensor histidine kinase/response regulator